MSTREEDRQKNTNPSRGLGIAAAALGVGVGAALYYFLSKKPENPDGEGSTTGWSCEQPHTFEVDLTFDDTDTSITSIDDSYTTISETTTTDTSIHSDTSILSDTSINSDISINSDPSINSDSEDSYVLNVVPLPHTEPFSLSEIADWDVTGSSLDVPSEDRRAVSPVRMMLGALFSPRTPRRSEQGRRETSEEEHRNMLRAQAFRERSWSLEECSICFEIMLTDQDLTRLPCAHNFHSSCLAPWLAEQQTCPNCRKTAE